jgi:hypothetical protein
LRPINDNSTLDGRNNAQINQNLSRLLLWTITLWELVHKLINLGIDATIKDILPLDGRNNAQINQNLSQLLLWTITLRELVHKLINLGIVATIKDNSTLDGRKQPNLLILGIGAVVKFKLDYCVPSFNRVSKVVDALQSYKIEHLHLFIIVKT